MPLTSTQRKERLEHGQQKEIAARLREPKSYVSLVMSGEVRPKTKRAKRRLRRAQLAIAKTLGLSIEEAFTEEEIGYAVLMAA